MHFGSPIHNNLFGSFKLFAPNGKPTGGAAPKNQTIDNEVEEFLSQNRNKVSRGSLNYFLMQALDEGLKAYRSGNYGIGSTAIIKRDGKIYVFKDRNAMVTGRGVHDHAEARAIFKAKRFELERLDQKSLSDDESRSFQVFEPDEIFDASINSYTQELDDGLHVFGTLEPCLMCMCIACRAGAKTSVSISEDGEATPVLNGKISDGGGYVLGDKIKFIPKVCEYIIQKLGLTFNLLNAKDRELSVVSYNLSRKTDGALVAAEKLLENSAKNHEIGSFDYYGRAALSEAVKAAKRGDDGRGAVAVLVRDGAIYEFRDGDCSKSGLGVKDIAASRVLEAARAYEQDKLERRYIPAEERNRYQHKMPYLDYSKRTTESTKALEDGLYLFTSSELDPQGMFVAMNAGVKACYCNSEDGKLIKQPGMVRSEGAAAAANGKTNSLPLKFQQKFEKTGILYKLLSAFKGEDAVFNRRLENLSDRLFGETRQEIDDMLGSRNRRELEQVPESFQLFYESGDIEISMAAIGADIAKWINSVKADGNPVRVITNISGHFVTADIRNYLPLDVKYSSFNLSGKDAAENPSNLIAHFDPSQDPEGSHYLMIDNVCDSGKTIKVLYDWLESNGHSPDKIKSLVLIDKDSEEKSKSPDWAVFKVSTEQHLVGRGLPYKGDFAGCRNIYVVDESPDA